jgi:RNA 3'-terminal phosphate cyclase (ATP)
MILIDGSEGEGGGQILRLKRPGFFPAGGGLFHARIEPVARLAPLLLMERGSIRKRRAKAWSSKLPSHVAERELAVVRQELNWRDTECSVENVVHPLGPGNALVLEIEAEYASAVFTGFGERGRAAEAVGRHAVSTARAWLEANVPVDEHLADQLLLPAALAGGSPFRTTKPSLHATTNAAVIRRFLSVAIGFEQENALVWSVTVGKG